MPSLFRAIWVLAPDRPRIVSEVEPLEGLSSPVSLLMVILSKRQLASAWSVSKTEGVYNKQLYSTKTMYNNSK